MKKKIAIVLSLILTAHIFAVPSASAATSLGGIEAVCALLIEQDGGTILYEQDIYSRHPADSLTKIMTLLLASQAVENGVISDNELIEMSESAWYDIDDNSITQSIQPGQLMTFIDLMYSAYVGGAEEACNMIALTMAGSIGAFVQMMNERAALLGCTETNFVNPHGGRYNERQYTCAYDMYLIFSEAMKNQLFVEISSTYRHLTERTEGSESRTLVSSNSMLNQSSLYYYRYCVSGLGSNTYEGGYSLVAAAEEDGLKLISVVLGAADIINADESVTLKHFTETRRLFSWGYENYGWRDIIKTSDLLARVPVEHGSGADFVNVRPEWPLTLLLDSSVTTESFVMDIVIFSERNNSPLLAPVSAGDKLGEVVVSRGDIFYDRIPLIANTDVELDGFEYMRRQIAEIFRTPLARNIIIILILIVVVYAALVIRYNIMRINRLRRIRNAKSDLVRERHENFRD